MKKALDEANRHSMEQFLRQLIGSGQTATALGEAARWGHIELVRELLQAGADVNSRDNAGSTPLMLAASGGNVEAMRLLLEAGADVNAQDDRKGMTPLMWLAAAMHPLRVYLQAAQLLLDAGADPAIEANDRTTVLDWANEGRPKKFVELLLEAGAKPGKSGGIQADINLDAFQMMIRRKGTKFVAVTAAGEIELPEPEMLKESAIDWLLQANHPPDELAASLLRRCDLSYDVATGKYVTEPLIEVVIAAPQKTHAVLRDEAAPVTQNILTALIEVCPDLGSHRLLRKS
jgi:hypothetical protein